MYSFEEIYDVKDFTEEQYQEWFKEQKISEPELKIPPDIFDIIANNSEELYKELMRIRDIVPDDRKILIDKVIESMTINPTFDDIVERYSPLIGIRGASYDHVIKMNFYSIIANQIKFNMFNFDGKMLDLRINQMYVFDAGYGKGEFKIFRKTIALYNNQVCQSPTSYHPEQFVGKIIAEGKGEEICYTPFYGILNCDDLIIDESYKLLTSKDDNDKQSLSYLRTALDPLGNNTIEKKQVNIPDEEKLIYNPHCTVTLFTQPFTDNIEELIDRGSLRRFIINIINTSSEERLQTVHDSNPINSDGINKKNNLFLQLNEVLKNLQKYKNLQYVFNESDFVLVKDYINNISTDIPAANKFIKGYLFNIKQNIYRFAIVRAVIDNKEGNIINVKSKHIASAIKDFDNTWNPLIQWICANMKIDIIQISDDERFILNSLKNGEKLQQDIKNEYKNEYKKIYPSLQNKSFDNKFGKIVHNLYEKMYIKTRPFLKNSRFLYLTESGKSICGVKNI